MLWGSGSSVEPHLLFVLRDVQPLSLYAARSACLWWLVVHLWLVPDTVWLSLFLGRCLHVFLSLHLVVALALPLILRLGLGPAHAAELRSSG